MIINVEPHERARKISIILGSNVMAVDCKITSTDDTSNLDLIIKKGYH